MSIKHESEVSGTLPRDPQGLVEALREALAWHEGEAKALSKQPPTPSLEWPKHQHRERIDALTEALAAWEAGK
jgi:hypothetical protein